MKSSGSGLTFTDHDVKMVRIVIGLLSRATFKDLDANTLAEGSACLAWIQELVPKIKENVYDLSTAKVVEPAPAPQSEPKGKRAKK